jgi:uncharacterized protein YndB with AHSA1/START domain
MASYRASAAGLLLSTALLACAPAENEVGQQDAALSGPEAPRNPSPLAVFFRSEALIAAEAAEIFDIIIDFDSYAEWNPFIIHAEGDAVVGAKVVVDAVMGDTAQRYDHVVIAVDPYSRFCWRDAGWNSWFAYAQRCRTLTPQADGKVRLMVETFIDGPFAKLAQAMYGSSLQNGQNAETAAIKSRAEQ